VAASENLYVVCGQHGSIYTSPHGSNWTARPTPTTNFLSSITAFPNGWVAVGDRGTLLRAGPDATTWTLIPLGTTNWLYRVRWVGQRLVVVGQNGTIVTGDSLGANWTFGASGTSAWLNDVSFVNGVWYVVGHQGTLLASTNLVAWAPCACPLSNPCLRQPLGMVNCWWLVLKE
jgi:photosystem II stability/assembly factor-like uncharacterized protein